MSEPTEGEVMAAFGPAHLLAGLSGIHGLVVVVQLQDPDREHDDPWKDEA